MTITEEKQRIKASKIFLERFKLIKEEIKIKYDLIEDLQDSQKPKGYKENLQYKDVKVQNTKSQNTEKFLNKFNDTIENLIEEIENLENFRLNGLNLINQLKNRQERLIITHYYFLNKKQTDYKKISKTFFFDILKKGLINFSYILEKKEKELKEQREKLKAENNHNISDISDSLKKEN